jgi:hypothetical protein
VCVLHHAVCTSSSTRTSAAATPSVPRPVSHLRIFISRLLLVLLQDGVQGYSSLTAQLAQDYNVHCATVVNAPPGDTQTSTSAAAAAAAAGGGGVNGGGSSALAPPATSGTAAAAAGTTHASTSAAAAAAAIAASADTRAGGAAAAELSEDLVQQYKRQAGAGGGLHTHCARTGWARHTTRCCCC